MRKQHCNILILIAKREMSQLPTRPTHAHLHSLPQSSALDIFKRYKQWTADFKSSVFAYTL